MSVQLWQYSICLPHKSAHVHGRAILSLSNWWSFQIKMNLHHANRGRREQSRSSLQSAGKAGGLSLLSSGLLSLNPLAALPVQKKKKNLMGHTEFAAAQSSAESWVAGLMRMRGSHQHRPDDGFDFTYWFRKSTTKYWCVTFDRCCTSTFHVVGPGPMIKAGSAIQNRNTTFSKQTTAVWPLPPAWNSNVLIGRNTLETIVLIYYRLQKQLIQTLTLTQAEDRLCSGQNDDLICWVKNKPGLLMWSEDFPKPQDVFTLQYFLSCSTIFGL